MDKHSLGGKKMNHSFNVDLAAKYGIEEAIILENLAFWIKKNGKNGKNFVEGEYWTYNSATAFQELFPYMGIKKIQRSLAKLEDAGVLKSSNFNKLKIDKTKWYTIADSHIKEIYGIDWKPEEIPLDILSLPLDKKAKPLSPNDQPLPYINTYINTDKKNRVIDTKGANWIDITDEKVREEYFSQDKILELTPEEEEKAIAILKKQGSYNFILSMKSNKKLYINTLRVALSEENKIVDIS